MPAESASPPPREADLPEGLVRGHRKGEQLRDILEDLVARSEPGEMVPSERDLAQRFGVARMTVRGAIGSLAAEGLVYRLQGQGTFVAPPKITQPDFLTSFSEDMAARSMEPSSLVLAQEVLPADASVAPGLGLIEGEPVVRIERIRRGDGKPIALERAHLPAKRFPGLEHLDLQRSSLYELLEERYGCAIAESEQVISAVKLTEAEAHLLQADPDLPALRIERRTRCRRGEPVELVRSLYRGDRYQLHTRLVRPNAPEPEGSSVPTRPAREDT